MEHQNIYLLVSLKPVNSVITIDSWEDASFDHNNTSFPLVGVHTTTDCAQCHTSGYAGTPSFVSIVTRQTIPELRIPVTLQPVSQLSAMTAIPL